ncbi:MAG: PilZ domain-containing protein [Myxococcales bacterium]|nr:PilZ domain-containing protein [Myxococcales bacterium]
MGDWEDLFASAARQSGPRESAALVRLRAAAEMGTPISLMAAHMALSCAGHLREASPGGVVIELPHPPRGSLLGAMVAISFPAAGKATGFTSPVTHVEPRAGGAVAVTLAVPERIQMGQQRASVRVPVPLGTMRAAILHGETPQPVVAIDLSLQGILVEYPDGQVPDIEEGHRRMVSLELDGKSVLLEAEVRRRDGPRYGMLFILREGRPSGLVAIVTALQYRWSSRSREG